jgi:hypothetical protein
MSNDELRKGDTPALPETFAPGELVATWLEAAAEAARRLPSEHPECVKRTDGSKTGKRYETAGIRFAWLWEVLIAHVPASLLCPGRAEVTVEQREDSFSVSMAVSLRIMNPNGSGEVLAETSAIGNHSGRERGDVLRGAETSGLKRCLANWGIGIEAFKGTLGAAPGRTPSGTAGQGNKNRSAPGQMDDRALLLEVKKRAAVALRERKQDVAAERLSCPDDVWDFARLNKLQVGDLTPELRHWLHGLLQDLQKVTA